MGTNLQGLNPASDKSHHDLDTGHLGACGVSENLDFLQELLDLDSLGLVQLVSPRPLLLDFLPSGEGIKTHGPARRGLVTNIKPSLPPALGRVHHIQVEVLDARANGDVEAAGVELTRLSLHLEDMFEKRPMRMNAQEALTQSEIHRKV